MLGLFAKKSDHPLADNAQAVPMMEALAKGKPEAAIEEATGWLESLSGLDDFPATLRYQRVAEFDNALIAQARRLGRDYYTGQNGSRFEEQKRWQRNHNYWTFLALAYSRCLADVDSGAKGSQALKAEIGLLYARLLHALAGRLRWTRLRYGRVDGNQWHELGAIYLRATRERLADRAVQLYGNNNSSSSPAIEYLKILLFHASSIDNLTLTEIGITERLLAHFRPHFVFSDKPTPETTYWVDTALDQPPARLVLERSPAMTSSLRLFGAGQVLQEVTALSELIRTRKAVPAELNLGGQYPPEVVLPVLDHLAVCWSPKPPQRKHTRHAIKGGASVVSGLSSIYWMLSGGSGVLDALEEWQVEDVSQGGMSVRLPLLKNDWIRVGALVALQPEGNENWLVGTIRRFTRESEAQGTAGIQTLSKLPRTAVATDGTLTTEIILLDPLRDDSTVRILVAPSHWEIGIRLCVNLGDKPRYLYPDERIETGDDWLLGRCIVEG